MTGSVLVEEIVEEEESAEEDCLHVRGAVGGEGQGEPGQCAVCTGRGQVSSGNLNVSSVRYAVAVNGV